MPSIARSLLGPILGLVLAGVGSAAAQSPPPVDRWVYKQEDGLDQAGVLHEEDHDRQALVLVPANGRWYLLLSHANAGRVTSVYAKGGSVRERDVAFRSLAFGDLPDRLRSAIGDEGAGRLVPMVLGGAREVAKLKQAEFALVSFRNTLYQSPQVTEFPLTGSLRAISRVERAIR